ncbi:F0F1 ATP synthase subunit delta [Kytococcus schroeteri]|uniref:ATP synthase subunit delta n=1 Tax=Kytococcus schroeteri TaxID=138300 RepID=A0A2I1PD61_9MICO|nr:F0F1 ATP synthase subunit delta [Kytococcus schroeteri]PKZ42544.1 F0F1 ATP synthase subunit delta [Kytococcus schroeteri]
MQGTSIGAYAASRDALEQQLGGGAQGMDLADQLFGAAEVLGDSGQLRRALTDPTRAGEDRARLAEKVFASATEPARRVLVAAAGQRWRSEGDLGEAVIRLGVESVLGSAERTGSAQRVADELFSVQETFTGDTQLRAALTDRRVGRGAKRELVQRLLGGKVAPETLRLVEQSVAGAKSLRFDLALRAYREIAAARAARLIAVAHTAVPLTTDQQERLRSALATQYGREITLNTVIDPDVVGGVRVEVADDVIDGTVSRRLAEARDGMVGRV